MDRYTIIKNGIQDEWLPRSPIRIEKYNILFDNIEKTNVIQIKFKNISEKMIKSIWIGIEGYDDAKDKTVSLSEVAFLDVNANIHQSFGSNVPVKLNSSTTVNVKIIIEKVVFDDEFVWRNEDKAIGILIPHIKAFEVYGDLYDQYAIELQKIKLPIENAFVDENDFWVCPCGQANEKHSEICCSCSTKYADLKSITNRHFLSQAKEERLIREKELAERRKQARKGEERRRREKEEAERKTAVEEAERKRIENERKKKRTKIMVLSAFSVCILGIGLYNMPKIVKYNKAIKMVKNGEFDTAIETFVQLNGFLHLEDKIEEANQLNQEKLNSEAYSKAEKVAAIGDIENLKEAAHIYAELGEYSDSSQKLAETYYNIAVIEYNSGDYGNAASHYKLCGNYNNAAQMEISANNQVTLMNAANAYNSGRYEDAVRTTAGIKGVKSAKQGIASADEIAEWSKQKIYDQATSGKINYTDMITKLEFLSRYNYKDSSQKIQNIKNKFNAISGYYGFEILGDVGASYTITADYKTNKVVIKKHLAIMVGWTFKDHDFTYTETLSASSATYGSVIGYDNSSFNINFYNGYITDTQFDNGNLKFKKL